MTKKIVFLGGEDVSARIPISNKLMEKGWHVRIIGSESSKVFIENEISYTKITLNRDFNIISDFGTLRQIRQILKRITSKTIIHAFDTKLTILLPIASLGLKQIIVVRTINGMGRVFSGNAIKNKPLILVYNLIQRVIKNLVDFTIFQNTANHLYFIEKELVDKNKSNVIKSSGIDLIKFNTYISAENLNEKLKLCDAETTFIFISRLIVEKGVLNYLEAARICKEKGHNFNFILVGNIDSNDKQLSNEKISRYDNVIYLGKRTDVRELLSISDVFVLPTYYSEGVPRVLLEASASGLALLTTNMAGCNDVLIDGVNGFFVKPKDSNDLSLKMIEISSNSNHLKSFKWNSKQHVKTFCLDSVTKECFKVYNSMLNLHN